MVIGVPAHYEDRDKGGWLFFQYKHEVSSAIARFCRPGGASREPCAMMRTDLIPLHVLEAPQLHAPPPDDAVLLVLDPDSPPGAHAGWLHVAQAPLPPGGAPQHGAACACCIGPAQLGATLMALFQKRARGDIGFFRSLTILVPAGLGHEIRSILARDIFAMAYYRLG